MRSWVVCLRGRPYNASEGLAQARLQHALLLAQGCGRALDEPRLGLQPLQHFVDLLAAGRRMHQVPLVGSRLAGCRALILCLGLPLRLNRLGHHEMASQACSCPLVHIESISAAATEGQTACRHVRMPTCKPAGGMHHLSEERPRAAQLHACMMPFARHPG